MRCRIHFMELNPSCFEGRIQALANGHSLFVQSIALCEALVVQNPRVIVDIQSDPTAVGQGPVMLSKQNRRMSFSSLKLASGKCILKFGTGLIGRTQLCLVMWCRRANMGAHHSC